VAGEARSHALTLSSTSASPVRMLDVRHGRRPDVQDNYFEVIVLQHGRPVETPIAISDPGPLSAGDFFDLRPGERTTLQHLSYARALDELRPGEYEAVVLVWRDPMEPPTTRCRSKAARFTVKK
jgi:hypothetical protein